MRRVVVGVLIVLVVAAGLSGLANYAYNIGMAQGVARAAAPPAPGAAPAPSYYPGGAYPGYPYGAPWRGPFGFGFAGLLWPILLIFLIAAMLRRSMWRGGTCGPRGEAPRWLDEWHRRAHESSGSPRTV